MVLCVRCNAVRIRTYESSKRLGYVRYAMAVCCCSPRPAMPSRIVSPAFRYTGGFCPNPTPGGVPVVVGLDRRDQRAVVVLGQLAGDLAFEVEAPLENQGRHR